MLVAIWRTAKALASINEVTIRRARLAPGWVTGPGFTDGAGNLSEYITSHSGQLSLAIPPWVGTICTSQRAVMLCNWGVKAGMVRVWVTGKKNYVIC